MSRLKNILTIGLEKTPGFGISKRFYLTVLAGRAQLPVLREIVNPKGEGGAVVGYGVPLMKSSTKEDLDKPLTRGAYAVATLDRKTVLNMAVMSREEAGFDPRHLLGSDVAARLTDEAKNRVASTWSIVQFSFQSHHPAVAPALDFLLGVCVQTAKLSEGVIADAVSEDCLLPDDVGLDRTKSVPINARNFVRVKYIGEDATVHIFTLGLQKFALPEIEITELDRGVVQQAGDFLMGLAQSVLRGQLLKEGARVGDPGCPLVVAPGGLDRRLWDGIPCFELIPERGQMTEAALRGWAETAGVRKS